jgi:hypothetical protein
MVQTLKKAAKRLKKNKKAGFLEFAALYKLYSPNEWFFINR